MASITQVDKSITATSNDGGGIVINVTLTNTTATAIANLVVTILYNTGTTAAPVYYSISDVVALDATGGTSPTASVSLALPSTTTTYTATNLTVGLGYTA